MQGEPTRGACGPARTPAGLRRRLRAACLLGLLLIGAGAICGPPMLVGAAARGAVWSGSRAASPGPAGHPALHVIPFPNTPDASTQSQIIFSSLVRSEIRRVRVLGSASGVHPGRLETLPDHAGTAFVPRRRFAAGETVSVQASLTSSAAGTAEGAPGSKHLSFSFSVAASTSGATASNRVARSSNDLRPASQRGKVSRSQTGFHSEPGLNPPAVNVSTRPAPGSADIFLSPIPSSQPGLMILSPRGQLFWFHPFHRLLPFNLEVQRYHGQPVLTWWQGHVFNNHGVDGQDVIVNHSYRPVAVLHGAWGYTSDLHEFQLTPQGTALIDDFVPAQANLTSLGGPANGVVYDCVIQELDVRSGRVLWEWHALGHVPPADSYAQFSASGPYDYFHLNSIQQLPHHRLLISSPNTHALYLIDESTGHVIWTVGGKHPSFKMGPGTGLELQHDAHLHGRGLLTVFDDGQAPVEQQSSAKELTVDTRRRTVSLDHAYRHSPPLVSRVEGSAQLLGNGDMFVGWGNEPFFSEYTPSGRQIFDGSFAVGATSYRAYRFAWTGHPRTRPAVALTRSRKGVTWVYVSWNGSTQVARWRVTGGSTPNNLKALKTKRWSGFETSIALPAAPHYLAVQALGLHGRLLGISRTMARPRR